MIREKLNNSLIIEEQDFYNNFDGTEVIIGSKVAILYNGEEEEYLIVGDGEEDPFNNVISYNCDFANKLIGKKLNEEFQYKGANIKIQRIELLSNE